MKHLLLIFFLYFTPFNSLFAQVAQVNTYWPVNLTNHSIELSYNSYEYVKNPSTLVETALHNGIDIPAPSGSFVVAIADGKIERVVKDHSPLGWFIYLKLNSGELIAYGHVDLLSNKHYTYLTPFVAGEEIGSVLSAADAQTAYDHCHFCVFKNNTQWYDYPNNCINPLSQSFMSNDKDPGGIPPTLGELIIEPFPYLGQAATNPSLANCQPSLNSLNCQINSFIYGKVRVLRQAFDNMNNEQIVYRNESWRHAWCTNQNQGLNLFPLSHQDIAAPSYLSFEIKNEYLVTMLSKVEYDSRNQSNPGIGNSSLEYDKMNLLYSVLHYDNDSPRFGVFNPKPAGSSITYDFSNLDLIVGKYLNTRLQKSELWNGTDASVNEEAQFSDGRYHFLFEAKDLVNSTPDDIIIVIDNFKPYVKNVVVNAIENTNGGGVVSHEIYRADWNWTTQRKLELTPVNLSDRLKGQYKPGAGNLIQIRVEFSELMDPNEVRLSLRSNCIYLDPTTTSQTVGSPTTQDNKTFVFTIEDQNLVLAHSELQTIEIFGKDKVGSDLMGFSESTTHGLIDADELSYRSPDGLGWINDDFGVSNMDNTHHFSIQGCFDPNRRLSNGTIPDGPMSTGCLIADFSGSTNDPFPSTISVFEFIDQSTLGSTPAAVNYNWDFGDAQFSSLQNPSHIYSSPGIYDVTLTISDGTDTDTKTKHSYIVVNASGASLVPDFSIIPNVGLNVGDQISLLNSTSGGSGNVSYEWTLDGCNPSSSNSVSPQAITISASGQHTITLKVYDDDNLNGLLISKTFSASQNGNISPLNASITNDLPQGNSYQFHANISGGNPPYSSFWDFGDGSGSSDPNPSHNFLPGHQYTVQLEVYDVGGGLINRSTNIQTSSQGGVTDLDFFADQTYFTSCPAMVNLHATYHSPDPFATSIQWTLTQTDVPPNTSATFGGDNIGLNLPPGVYDVEVTATYNGIVSSPVRKTAYLQLCQPDPTLFEVTRFDLVKNCLGTSFNIDVRNGIGFPIGDPATSSTDYLTLLKFGIDIHTFQGTVNNLALSNRPGYTMVYTLESTSSSTTFPKTVTYTLKVYENNLVNGVYNHITYTKSFVFPSSCLSENDIDVGSTSLSLCPGKSIILGGAPVLAPDIGVPPISYHWDVTAGTLSNPADRPNPIYTAPGGNTTATATLTVSDGSGMSFSKSLLINVTPISVNAGPDLNICVHNSVNVTNVNVIGGSGT